MIANIADYSSLLNDSNPITNVVFGVGDATITVQDTLPSTLEVGKVFIIRNALFKNEIVSLTPIIGVGYQAETLLNHDLTENFQEIVQIIGFGGAWDDTFTIVSVDGQKTFTFSTTLGAPVGTGYILEDRFGTIRGVQTITAITATTITFAITTPFQVYDFTNGITANYNYRITSNFDEESAKRHYNERTSANNAWAYVLYDGSLVSKDNSIDSDSFGRHTKIEAFSAELDINFSILIIKDNSDKNTTREIQDELLDFRFALCKSVLGYRIIFDNYTNSSRYLISLLGDSPAFYEGAYYGHLYSFQTQLIISTNDTVDNKNVSALKDFDIGLFLEFDNYEKLKKEIEIDLSDS
jgi:hypothetical protein